jgi:LemA protein
LAWIADRRRRLFTDQATTPAAAVFAGRNEVKGRAWTATPLFTCRTGQPTVCWTYVLEEEREHTRQVSDTDSEGHTTYRTETHREWHVVDRQGGGLPTFEVVDDTGSVPIVMDGARTRTRELYSQIFRQDREGGFFQRMFDDRTGRYRETESGIAVGDPLFVVGDARLNEPTGVPFFGGDVLVSTRSEEQYTSMWGAAATFLAIVAAGATVFGMAVALSPDQPEHPTAWLPGVALVALALVTAWGVILNNRLRLLAQAAERARSLVDVQLKRRHDLIPALAKVVAAQAAHEATLLEELTAARTTPDPGAAALEQTNALSHILQRAEAYPELRADDSFLRLQHELADAENRIAGSRTFYNDTVLLLRNKLDGFPGNLMAGRIRLHRSDAILAEGFERTVPELTHAFPTGP